KQNRIRNTFRNNCDEHKSLELNDWAEKVFINASGIRENADPDLAAFLDLVLGKSSDNGFAKQVQKAIDIVKLDREGRLRYMTVEMWIQEEAQIAREEGVEKGRDIRDQEKIEDMLRRGKKPEEIADFCGYPMELILKVEKGISEAK
ncbi:MAG: hypothetical protein ILP08_06100, partial [Lachnospiraceae bacterium]|nr:hypothetical protein [Lachnospiraceae bacterium]